MIRILALIMLSVSITLSIFFLIGSLKKWGRSVMMILYFLNYSIIIGLIVLNLIFI